MLRTSAPSRQLKRKGDWNDSTPLKQLNMGNILCNNNDNPDELSDHELLIQKILNQPFKIPIPNYTGILYRKSLGIRFDGPRRPLHDPFEDGALVLFEPPELNEQERLTIDKTKQLVHVVVDPQISKILRPHQREGVKFMYDCVTGRQIGEFHHFYD